MDLAIHYADFSSAGEDRILPALVATAKAADDGGASTLTVMDHWFQLEQIGRRLDPATDPMLSAYTTLGFLAGQTGRIRLGALVTGVTYRHPGLLAKEVTTLDVLSGGRAMLGIGAAWYEREHLGLGVPFPPVAERFERLDEALRIVRQMWSDDDGPFEGTHYRLAETLCRPQPVQRPAPPVLIGGMGEKKTLRLVAEHADACNLFAVGADVVGHKLDVLRGHCEDVGRDPAEITATVIGDFGPIDDVDAFLREMEAYAKLGVRTVWVGPPGDDPAGWVAARCEQLVPRLAEL